MMSYCIYACSTVFAHLTPTKACVLKHGGLNKDEALQHHMLLGNRLYDH